MKKTFARKNRCFNMVGVVPNSNTTMLLDDDDNDDNDDNCNDAVEKDDNDVCCANLINDGKEFIRLIEWNLTTSSANSLFRNIAEVT